MTTSSQGRAISIAAAALIVAILAGAALAVADSRGWTFGRFTPDAGFWGSIVGAIIGAGIAFTGQWITIIEARRQKLEEKHNIDLARGLSLLFKLITIYSNFENMGKYFNVCLDERPKDMGLKGEEWQFFTPMTSTPDAVKFTAEEMALILPLADEALLANCTALDDIHNGFLDSVRFLCLLRTALVDDLTPDEVGNDLVAGHFELTHKQQAKARAINSLVTRLRASCSADEQRSWAVMEGVADLLRRRLGSKVRISHRKDRPPAVV